MNSLAPVLTVKEAARLLGCSTQTVKRAIRDGSIRVIRIRPTSPYLIPESELTRIFDASNLLTDA